MKVRLNIDCAAVLNKAAAGFYGDTEGVGITVGAFVEAAGIITADIGFSLDVAAFENNGSACTDKLNRSIAVNLIRMALISTESTGRAAPDCKGYSGTYGKNRSGKPVISVTAPRNCIALQIKGYGL